MNGVCREDHRARRPDPQPTRRRRRPARCHAHRDAAVAALDFVAAFFASASLQEPSTTSSTRRWYSSLCSAKSSAASLFAGDAGFGSLRSDWGGRAPVSEPSLRPMSARWRGRQRHGGGGRARPRAMPDLYRRQNGGHVVYRAPLVLQDVQAYVSVRVDCARRARTDVGAGRRNGRSVSRRPSAHRTAPPPPPPPPPRGRALTRGRPRAAAATHCSGGTSW